MRGAWLSTFSGDAMRIMCLSLAGRWWRAEWETGLLKSTLQRKAAVMELTNRLELLGVAVQAKCQIGKITKSGKSFFTDLGRSYDQIMHCIWIENNIFRVCFAYLKHEKYWNVYTFFQGNHDHKTSPCHKSNFKMRHYDTPNNF